MEVRAKKLNEESYQVTCPHCNKVTYIAPSTKKINCNNCKGLLEILPPTLDIA